MCYNLDLAILSKRLLLIDTITMGLQPSLHCSEENIQRFHANMRAFRNRHNKPLKYLPERLAVSIKEITFAIIHAEAAFMPINISVNEQKLECILLHLFLKARFL